MSRELSATRGKKNILRAAVKHLHEVFDSPSAILLPDERDTIIYPRGKSLFGSLHGADLGIAQWVYDHGAPAGRGTDTLSGSDTLYLPMVGSERTLGVIALLPTDPRRVLVPEQQRLLQMFASQIALALERVELATQAQDTLFRMEAERLRNALLSTISHDLRTPLAAIVGAAGGLLSKTYQLNDEARKELVQTIQDEATRMSGLVNKVLEMAGLESGTVMLNRDWQTLEELVGAALTELDGQLAHHPVVTSLPAELPLIWVDGLMIQRVLTNLLKSGCSRSSTARAQRAEPWGRGSGLRSAALSSMRTAAVSGPRTGPRAGPSSGFSFQDRHRRCCSRSKMKWT
jgi:two-component system sensor histidine kinase KdpD